MYVGPGNFGPPRIDAVHDFCTCEIYGDDDPDCEKHHPEEPIEYRPDGVPQPPIGARHGDGESNLLGDDES